MKKSVLVSIIFIFIAAIFAINSSLMAQSEEKKDMVKTVFDFIKSCDHYFIATTEGDQPRVRPFSSLVMFEGKIYFQTGKVKNVSKQLAANQKIEICAYNGQGAWMRIQAVAVDDDRLAAKQYVLDALPELKTMYAADDGNTQVFYLKDVTANYFSFSGDNWAETF